MLRGGIVGGRREGIGGGATAGKPAGGMLLLGGGGKAGAGRLGGGRLGAGEKGSSKESSISAVNSSFSSLLTVSEKQEGGGTAGGGIPKLELKLLFKLSSNSSPNELKIDKFLAGSRAEATSVGFENVAGCAGLGGGGAGRMGFPPTALL